MLQHAINELNIANINFELGLEQWEFDQKLKAAFKIIKTIVGKSSAVDCSWVRILVASG
jgi:hypothetical protein